MSGDVRYQRFLFEICSEQRLTSDTNGLGARDSGGRES